MSQTTSTVQPTADLSPSQARIAAWLKSDYDPTELHHTLNQLLAYYVTNGDFGGGFGDLQPFFVLVEIAADAAVE